MTTLYRLPSGNTTTREYEYKEEWRDLADMVEEMFPGYRLKDFDPGMRFVSQDAADFFILSPKSALALKSALRHLRENR